MKMHTFYLADQIPFIHTFSSIYHSHCDPSRAMSFLVVITQFFILGKLSIHMHLPFIQFFSIMTSCKTVAQYCNQDIGIDVIHKSYLDPLSFACISLCLSLFNSWQFIKCLGSCITTTVRILKFGYHKDPSNCLFITTPTAHLTNPWQKLICSPFP